MSFPSREQILSASTLRREVVDVPELGEGVRVLVGEMDGATFGEYQSAITETKGEGKKATTEIVRSALLPALVIYSVINEDGSRVFSEADMADVARLPARALRRIGEVAQKMIGEDEDLGKD